MEVERAVAPQLVITHNLPHANLSIVGFSFFEKMVSHDGNDGGFHGLVRVSGPGLVRRRLAVRSEGIRLAIGTQVATQDIHHALPVSTLVGVRDVRQRVDTCDACGGPVRTQLIDSVLHLRVDEAVLLSVLLSFRALLIPSGLLPFLVLDHQIGHRAHAADDRQGSCSDARHAFPWLRCQMPQTAHDGCERKDSENDPCDDFAEQRPSTYRVLPSL